MISHPVRLRLTPTLALALLAGLSFWPTGAVGDDQPTTAADDAQWSAKDLDGNAVQLGDPAKPTVLLFLMSGQPQSADALKRVTASVKAHPGVDAVAIVSADKAADYAAKIKADWPGKVALDADYALAGRCNVHVWPTTVIRVPGGKQLAHMGGLPASLDNQVGAWLDFATGAIDEAALKRRLSGQEVVEDNPAQMAARHLAAADRLLDKGLVAQARDELERGLKIRPADSALQLAMARVLLLMDQPADAMALLDRIDASSVPPWKLDVVRGRALMAMEKWDQASAVLVRAVKLNPEPSEAYYALGQIYEHALDYRQAATAYRAAFENSPTGRKLTISPIPTTQPGE
ncbi:MAG: hypothetical protein BIFFINMI_03140 [Phycisphaerae bacterium]|nr:hypothetical protein [Phycisphaerae bacterium]